MRRRVLLVLLSLILLAIGLVARWHGRKSHGSARFPSAPIVLISVDTLRADHLPAYGYRCVKTPHIDRLRRDAILFDNAYSPVPLTLPAHVSLLTGLWPTQHLVRDNLGYRFSSSVHESLPRALSRIGYATGAAVSAYVLRAATGLGDCFDFYDDAREPPPPGAPPHHVERSGFKTTASARQWLGGVRDRPFFLLVHIFEPHAPYNPPKPFDHYRLAYDGEIAASDAIVGELLDDLRRDGTYDRAVIAFVSDHGEGLGEHGEQYHGVLLYRWALHVPLMIKLPGSERGGETANQPVSLVDIAPTLAALAGASMSGDLPGRALLDPSSGKDARDVYCETYYPRVHLGWSEQRGLIGDRFHYVEGPTPEMFDIVNDPAETADISKREKKTARAMAALLSVYPRNFVAPAIVESKDAEKLAALGYLDRITTNASGPRPDARRSIHLYEDLLAAFKLTSEGRDEEGVAALRALVARQPLLFDAWYEMAQALTRLERFEEAYDAYQAARNASPALAGPVALGLSLVCLELNRIDEAETHARVGLDVHPAQAHELLSRVALARNDLGSAEREAKMAVGDVVAELNARLLLAEVDIRRERYSDALAILEKTRQRVAAGETRPLRDLEFLIGDALARMERYDEAEAAFRREIRSFPRNARAYVRLAIVLALRGRARREVDGALEAMVAAHPVPETMRLAAEAYESLGNHAAARKWRQRMTSRKRRRSNRTMAQ